MMSKGFNFNVWWHVFSDPRVKCFFTYLYGNDQNGPGHVQIQSWLINNQLTIIWLLIGNQLEINWQLIDPIFSKSKWFYCSLISHWFVMNCSLNHSKSAIFFWTWKNIGRYEIWHLRCFIKSYMKYRIDQWRFRCKMIVNIVR